MNPTAVQLIRSFVGGFRPHKIKELHHGWKTQRTVHRTWKENRNSSSKHRLPVELVVSLTSYPARFGVLHNTLFCMLGQNVQPDRTILWIADEDKRFLPSRITDLVQSGLDIRYTANTRSYKKLVPALVEFPDAAIVTADDDVYYHPGWLGELASSFVPGNAELLCHRTHQITFDSDGRVKPYALWNQNFEAPTARDDLFMTGCGGTLYPPGVLHGHATDASRYMALCPTADDIWFNWMAWLNGGKIRKVKSSFEICAWPGSQLTALYRENVRDGGNDQQFETMIKTYGLPPALRSNRI
jgi:hypothetical protein